MREGRRVLLQTSSAWEEWSAPFRSKLESLLIVFDLDGTLVDDRLRMKAADLRSIERVRQGGAQVTLATGRTLSSALPFIEKLNIELPVIICNGAVILDPKTEKILFKRSVPGDMMQTVLSKTAQCSLDTLIYTDAVNGIPCTQMLTPYLSDFILLEGLHSVELNNLTEVIRKTPAVKVQVVGNHEALVRLRSGMIEANADVAVVMTQDDYLEVMPPGGSKGEALRKLCSLMNIPLANTLTFGDGRNDKELLEAAGLGVAMTDAPDDLKQSADLIAPHVAAVLNRFFCRSPQP